MTSGDRQMAIELIDKARLSGARLWKACGELDLDRKTYWRWREQLRQEQSLIDKRTLQRDVPVSNNGLTPEEKKQIMQVCNSPEFQSLPPSQIVPILADRGEYIASESSFYRVLKEHDQNHRRGRVSQPKNTSKPKERVVTGSNQCWSWDITFLKSNIAGMFFKLYLILDIFSRKIVGWEVHRDESSEHASVLVDKACKREKIKREQLILHSDNGSPMKGATLLSTLDKLGVVPSYSRPSVSNDNAYSESLFKTLKYSPSFPEKPFSDIEAARRWVYDFVCWYNTKHRHSAIKFVTPSERHAGLDHTILNSRHGVYQQARARNPERWSGPTRDWSAISHVVLNPSQIEEAGSGC